MLGYHEWREGLLRGLAAHHAGMLPVFRHTVEELFTAGLVKAVFATETLALGINMPARTVVLERLVKFNGEQHVPLTPGEYTQLTGRAGRRGIDVEGHAVVLWHPGHRTGRGRRPGLHPHLPAAQLVRAVVQHDDQPGAPDGPDAGAPAAGAVVRAVSGRPVGGRAGARHRARRADARRDRRRTRRPRRADPRLRAAARCRSPNANGRSPGRRGCSGARPPTTRWPRCAAATSSPSRTAGAAAWPSCWSPTATATTRGRWCSPKTVGRDGFRRPTTRARRHTLGSMTLPKRVEHRQPRVRRDLASALRSAAAGLDVPSAKGKRSGPPTERDVDPELAGAA